MRATESIVHVTRHERNFVLRLKLLAPGSGETFR